LEKEARAQHTEKRERTIEVLSFSDMSSSVDFVKAT
jgi:hypothetical protein